MTVLKNEESIAVACIYNHAVILTGSTVVGLVLGHYMYNCSGKIKGKFFDNVLYDEQGHIIALLVNEHLIQHIDTSSVIKDAWELLGKISRFERSWATPLSIWGPLSLDEVLLS